MLVFGPVPSRRLGRSLGINHIPPKTCTYGCLYCQVGRTTRMPLERQTFYPPAQIVAEVREKLRAAQAAGEPVDYVTFVPDGEPTLDLHLGESIAGVKALGVPVAVITNASLLWMVEVRKALMLADWVSLKADAALPEVWRRVDRPHGRLALPAVLEGIRTFAAQFEGYLVTETMLVRGVNDGEANLQATADFLAEIRPRTAYLSVPTRPPAEAWVRPPDEATLNHAYQTFAARLPQVELLIAYEGSDFAATGEAEEVLLATTAVHPLREEAALKLVRKAGGKANLLDRLVAAGQLRRVMYDGETFYVRHFAASRSR